MTNYGDVFKKVTGQELFPGTLNVRIDRQIAVREDFRIEGVEIGEPEQDLIFERCRINRIEAFRIRPLHLKTGSGGHGDHTLEIACSQKIPCVEIGTEVEVELFRQGDDS
jgi:CTP-dependent riboflavin kinase